MDNKLNKELLGIENQIEYLIKITSERLFQILPINSRSKRAIFSPLGSLVKAISGNLDEQDAIRYNNQIMMLQNKEYLAERKISSMQKAFDKLVNTSEIINSNMKDLGLKTSEMEAVIQNESKFNQIIHFMNSLYQILSNFRTCYENIQEIETAIAFSKLHILHQSIINSTELFNALLVISKHARTIYPVSKENLLKLQRNIILKSYIDITKLVFVLEIPLIDTETYNYYKVIPIPIYNSFNTHVIIPKYPYLLVNRLKYMPIARPCEEIENNRFLCEENNLIQYPMETCIEQIMLLKNNYSQCLQNHIKIEKTKIQKVNDNNWLIYSEENLVLTENCNNEVHKHNIQGTYILTPSLQCEIQIEDIIINASTNTTDSGLQLPVIQIPELQFHIETRTKKMDLRNVDFTDIKEVLQSAKLSYSDSENLEQNIVTFKISVWTVCLYIFVSIVGTVIIMHKFQHKLICRNSPKSSLSPSDNFSLGEGGVKEPQYAQISFVNNTTPRDQH